MKIAFFWTGDFSKNILQDLILKKDIDVKIVISQPDKPVWRKKVITQTPVKKLAIENNIEVLQPLNLKNNLELEKKLKSLNLDFIIVVAYGKIIPENILNIPKYYSINIHWSILPLYRWASPIQESIKNWDKKTWITIMQMTAWMDEWWIFAIKEVDIDILDKTPDIFMKFENIWWDFLVKVLKDIINFNLKPIPQDEKKASYCKKIKKTDWEINFKSESVIEIYNKYRAYFPWPWIYSFYNWKKIEFSDIFYEENDLCYFDKNFSLWDVVEFKKNWKKHICIICNWWMIILKKVKLEWKKEIDIFDFVNWNKEFLKYNFINH